jgi:DNA-binding GntR family transcriptional regulator
MSPILTNQPLSVEAETPSLADRVYNRIFQGIVSGEIPGETRLVAATLAQQLGVSITPVRESLLRLANEGMVKPIPRVGYIVETMSEADVIDLFEARIAIERLIAALAVQKITAADILYLENNLKRMNEVLAQGQTEEMVELDTAFHQFIAKVAGNKTLFSVSQLMTQRTYRFRLACLRTMDVAETTRNGHVEVVKAFKEKDAEKVDKAILSHLGEVSNHVCAYLAQVRHSAPSPIKMSL